MCADGIHWECDLARQEFAIFPRDREGFDSRAPALVCTVDEWLDCVVPGDRRRVRGKLFSLFATATRSFEVQFRVAVPGGGQQWTDLCAIVVRDAQGTPERIVGHQCKLGAIGEYKPSPLPSAYHDPLTGLPNRRLFEWCLAEAIEGAQQDRAYRFAVLFVDLDGFKQINDRHGHLMGDRALLAVAQRFSHCVRPQDIVARRDGDEFTILLKDLWQPGDATAVADRILEHLRTPLALDGAELVVTVSIGIALSYAELTAPDDLLRFADCAMYRAKAQGGDRYVTAGLDSRNPADLRSAG
ncbi:MAG: sensor domain-containing diguanylate cyclase [Pirellulales bacterium]